VTIAPSLGTAGGLRALRDGAIDVAVCSRDLTPTEAAGLTVAQLAKSTVVLAAGTEVPDREIPLSTLEAALRGMPATWSDGTRIELLLREPGDSGTLALSQLSPALRSAFDDALSSRRWPVLHTDQAMELALVSRSRCIGAIDRQTISLHDLPLRPLGLVGDPAGVGLPAGVRLFAGTGLSADAPGHDVPRDAGPSAAHSALPGYPPSRPLLLATRPDASNEAMDFVAYACSSDGKQLLLSLGYVPGSCTAAGIRATEATGEEQVTKANTDPMRAGAAGKQSQRGNSLRGKTTAGVGR